MCLRPGKVQHLTGQQILEVVTGRFGCIENFSNVAEGRKRCALPLDSYLHLYHVTVDLLHVTFKLLHPRNKVCADSACN